eukprot:Awhi_evm1s3980
MNEPSQNSSELDERVNDVLQRALAKRLTAIFSAARTEVEEEMVNSNCNELDSGIDIPEDFFIAGNSIEARQSFHTAMIAKAAIPTVAKPFNKPKVPLPPLPPKPAKNQIYNRTTTLSQPSMNVIRKHSLSCRNIDSKTNPSVSNKLLISGTKPTTTRSETATKIPSTTPSFALKPTSSAPTSTLPTISYDNAPSPRSINTESFKGVPAHIINEQ